MTMKVRHYDLDEMIQELKEKNMSEVRIQAIQEQEYNQTGLPYVSARIVVTAQHDTTIFIYERPAGVTIAYDKDKVKAIQTKAKEIENKIKEKFRVNRFNIHQGIFSG